MIEEKLETTDSENGDEEKTSEKTTEETPKEDIEAKNRQLFERTKKAEQRAKVEEAEKLILQKQTKVGETPDSSELAKTVVAMKDYTPAEIDYIFKQAKFLGITPTEAISNEDVQLFLEAKREKLQRSEKTPEPSTKQIPDTKGFEEWTNDTLREATQAGDYEAIDKFREWMRKK